MGRTCKYDNNIISDEIYSGAKKCDNFRSIQNENIDYPNDTCCSENSRYFEVNNNEKN